MALYYYIDPMFWTKAFLSYNKNHKVMSSFFILFLKDLTTIFECIGDIIGTASDCLPCICDILELIPGIEVTDCPEK